jgi:hypothetical protein
MQNVQAKIGLAGHLDLQAVILCPG